MANTNAQAISDGGIVNFGSIIRRYGCNVQSDGSTPYVNGSGYYDVDANITLTAGAAGTVVLQLLENGSPITGARQSATVAAGTIYAFNVPAIVRQRSCCDKTITLRISGVATTVNNAAIEVIKE